MLDTQVLSDCHKDRWRLWYTSQIWHFLKRYLNKKKIVSENQTEHTWLQLVSHFKQLLTHWQRIIRNIIQIYIYIYKLYAIIASAWHAWISRPEVHQDFSSWHTWKHHIGTIIQLKNTEVTYKLLELDTLPIWECLYHTSKLFRPQISSSSKLHLHFNKSSRLVHSNTR